MDLPQKKIAKQLAAPKNYHLKYWSHQLFLDHIKWIVEKG